MSFYVYDNESELIEEVKRKLGHPMVKVEIDDSQWKDVIKSSKRWFMSRKSLVSLTYVNYNQSTNPIAFSDIDPVNGVYAILEVYPDEVSYGPKGEDTTYYEILPYGYPVWGASTYSFGSRIYNQSSFIYQIFASLEKRRKLYGAEKDWFIQEDHINGHKLYMTPSTRCGRIGIVYKPAILPITALKGRDAELFYLYALATAKETLGRIRSKYSDYPGAGGNISMDGGALLEEAKTEKEWLEDQIAGSQGPSGIVFG
jgi:hypothetical protein